jgi:hypothetical protein
MENKQTSVEWLFKQLWNEPKDKLTWYAILKQAKEMEKENTIAFADKYDAYVVQGGTLTAEHYYEEKYGK